MRFITCGICLTVLLFSSIPGGAGHLRSRSQVSIRVDGKLLPTEPSAVIRGGRIFVPVVAFQKIGLGVQRFSSRRIEVGWPESDYIIEFRAGKRTYTVDGPTPSIAHLPGTPFMRGGALMVPLRSMLSNTDVGASLTAEWNARTRTLHIHRSKRWLRWRLRENGEMIKARGPFWYVTPI